MTSAPFSFFRIVLGLPVTLRSTINKTVQGSCSWVSWDVFEAQSPFFEDSLESFSDFRTRKGLAVSAAGGLLSDL